MLWLVCVDRNPLQHAEPLDGARRHPIAVLEVGKVDVQAVELPVRVLFGDDAGPAVGLFAGMDDACLDIVITRIVEDRFVFAGLRIEPNNSMRAAAVSMRAAAVGRPAGNEDPAVCKRRRRVEQPVARPRDRPVGVQRPPQPHASKRAGPVPRNLVGLDKHGQSAGRLAGHVPDSAGLLAGEQRVIGPVDVHAEQRNPTACATIERTPLPGGKQQPPVGHQKRVHVAGEVERQPADRRAVQSAGIEVGRHAAAGFVDRARGVADKSDLVPRLRRDDRVQG